MPQTDAPPTASEAGAPPPLSARCPHCEAELKNLRAEPGQSVRCLNCEKRFVPIPAAATTEVATVATVSPASPRPSLPREVRAPGYWLLRVPAILACIGAVITSLIMLVSVLGYSYRIRFSDFVFMSYAVLLPLGGFVLLFLTQSIARIDAGMANLLEHRNPGEGTLPPLTSSSLPYILPLAVTGGIVPLVAFASMDSMEQSVVFAVFGGSLFYQAFAMEDVRQFLWRQSRFAERMIPGAATAQRANLSTLNFALLSLGCAVCAVLIFESANRREAPIFAFIACSVFGTAMSLGRLDSHLSALSDRWRNTQAEPVSREPFILASPLFFVAALLGFLLFGMICYISSGSNYFGQSVSSQDRLERAVFAGIFLGLLAGVAAFLAWHRILKVRAGFPRLFRRLAIFPLGWALLGAAFMAVEWLKRPMFYNFYREAFAGFLMMAFLFYLALWTSDLLMRVAHWRRGIENSINPSASIVELPSLQFRFIGLTVQIAIVQAVLLTILFADEFRWRSEECFLFPLALGLFHYPTIWFALVLRELWRIQAALALGTKTSDEG